MAASSERGFRSMLIPQQDAFVQLLPIILLMDLYQHGGLPGRAPEVC